MSPAATILLIETSTHTCSIGVCKGEKLLSCIDSGSENDHAAHITLYINQALGMAGCTLSDLNAVAVSLGPGSYTGLRIGVSTAKALCYALKIPLIGIPTLESFAYYPSSTGVVLEQEDIILSLMDARRMEVYASAFDTDMNCVMEAQAMILQADSFRDLQGNGRIHILGDGALKARPVIEPQARLIWYEDFTVSARFLCLPACKYFNNSKFLDLAYSEPFYLKEYIAGAPKVKGLH